MHVPQHHRGTFSGIIMNDAWLDGAQALRGKTRLVLRFSPVRRARFEGTSNAQQY